MESQMLDESAAGGAPGAMAGGKRGAGDAGIPPASASRMQSKQSRDVPTKVSLCLLAMFVP